MFNDQNDSSDSAIKLKNDNESESSSSPSLPPKIPSPHEEYTLPPILSSADKKIYTIFESPTSTPSQDDERIESDSPKVSDDNNNLTDMSGLSYYYQNIITKQVLRTCL